MSNVSFIFSPKYKVDIGSHVFPTEKYELVKAQFLKSGRVNESDFLEPSPASSEQLLTVHTPEYVDDLYELRRTHRTLFSELPVTRDILHGSILCAGGTLLSARRALERGIAVHLGGGFHHAFPDHAEGFCYINDIAVAIKVLKSEKAIHRAFVVDCDLHQGNGTAVVFQNDPDVFTFSIHQERNYPMKEKSDIDIGLEDHTGDEEYLRRLGEIVPEKILDHTSDLVIYVAGADPYKEDQLGGLNLTIDGLKSRDTLVLNACRQHRIPCAVVLAGGYAERVWDTVAIHTNTCLTALEGNSIEIV